MDAMRGIAILMVILVHTAQQVSNLNPLMRRLSEYGQMGVQIFFIISAYTLCFSFERRTKEPYKILSFYIRRLFRIAPLFYLAIPIYFCLHIAKQLYKSGHISSIEPYSITNIAVNMLFIQGVIPASNINVVPGGWAIGTEMAFYLFFPILFVISKKIYRKSFFQLFSLLLLCVGINLAFQLAISEATKHSAKYNNFLYQNVINQLPVFIIGIIVYFLHQRIIMPSIIYHRALSVFGFLFFSTIALLLFKSKIELFAVIPTISAVSFAFLLNWLKVTKRQVLILCKFGEVSFSVYIFHFLFAWHLTPKIMNGLSNMISAEIMLLLSFLLTSALTFVVARITERTIEAKGISAGARVISHLQAKAILSL